MVRGMRRVVYVCGVCDVEWDDEFRAEDCCPKVIERVAWRCQDCGSDYESQHDANECCANQSLDSYNINKASLGGKDART